MNHIEKLRVEINDVDTQIIELIAKRQQIALAIGEYKKQNNLPVFDPKREILLREFHKSICEKYSVAPDLVAKLFELLIEESRKVQQHEC